MLLGYPKYKVPAQSQAKKWRATGWTSSTAPQKTSNLISSPPSDGSTTGSEEASTYWYTVNRFVPSFSFPPGFTPFPASVFLTYRGPAPVREYQGLLPSSSPTSYIHTTCLTMPHWTSSSVNALVSNPTLVSSGQFFFLRRLRLSLVISPYLLSLTHTRCLQEWERQWRPTVSDRPAMRRALTTPR